MYACRRCGRVEARPLPVCPACGTWSPFLPLSTEDKHIGTKVAPPPKYSLDPGLLGPLPQLPAGSVLLLGGPPGVGKSTLALQVAGSLTHEGPIVYVCAEERAEVVKDRAKRLGIQTKNILFLEEFLVGRVLQAAEGTVGLVVDSLPAMTTRASLLPGGAAAQREVTLELVRFARKTGALVLLVTQVAKKGLAGPRLVEHLVDVVLILSAAADGTRLLRVTKNRLGPAGGITLLRMTASGLFPLSHHPG